MDPFFITDTPKSFEEASTALQEAVVDHGFGMIRPEVMLAGLSADPSLKEVARAVEASTTAIIAAAA